MNNRVRDGMAVKTCQFAIFDFFGDDRIYRARTEPCFSLLQEVISSGWDVLEEWPWL